MATITEFYWLPHCSTCQKAKQWLDDKGVTIKKTIDVKTEAVSAETIEHLCQLIGSSEALFSKRAMKYRSLGLHEQTLSDADMKDWMVKEYTFIKRPVLVTSDNKILAGFSAKQYAALFN